MKRDKVEKTLDEWREVLLSGNWEQMTKALGEAIAILEVISEKKGIAVEGEASVVIINEVNISVTAETAKVAFISDCRSEINRLLKAALRNGTTSIADVKISAATTNSAPGTGAITEIKTV